MSRRTWVDGVAGGTPLTADRLNALEGDIAAAIKAWTPSTSYTAGTAVVSPNNDVVTAKADHVSGTSFNPANWSLSSTYALASSVPPANLDGGNATSTYSGTFNFDGGSAA